MPRYRFNLEDHRVIADRGSHDCHDEAQAREIADEIAEHLAQAQPELVDGRHRIVVRDSANRQVYAAVLNAADLEQRRH
jgi:hypothetical protein